MKNRVGGQRKASFRCAEEVFLTIPMVMRSIGKEMEKKERLLSMREFRALMMLQENGDVSLSSAAGMLDVSLPAASKLVDALIERGFVERERISQDRRQVRISITRAGEEALQSMHLMAAGQLALALEGLKAEDYTTITGAMALLRAQVCGGPRAGKP